MELRRAGVRCGEWRKAAAQNSGRTSVGEEIKEPNAFSMASSAFKIVLGTVAVLAFGGVMVAVRLDNAHIGQQLARLHGQRQQAERTRAENHQLQEIITRAKADAADGARAIHADVVRARTEVDELER